MTRPTISIPRFLIRALSRAGFVNILEPNVFGPAERLHLPATVGTMNTLFNTMSGDIWVGDDTFFGHNVMVITGKHYDGGEGLYRNDFVREGRDIHIGSNCWICSGVIIPCSVTIGDNCTIKAGSIVTKDVPDNTTVAGIWK
jgi:acetyltransferase-like isoleucine patch superfamily enzyme